MYELNILTAGSVLVEVSPLECTISANKQLLEGLPNYSAFIRRQLPHHTISLGETVRLEIGGRIINLFVRSITPVTAAETVQGQQYRINRDTTVIKISTALVTADADKENDETLNSLLDMIRSGFDNVQRFHQLGIPVAKSILLHGVSGVGKFTTVKRASQHLGCYFLDISMQDLLAVKEEWDLEAFKRYNPLHLIINKSLASTPSVVVIRDLNVIGKENDKLLDILASEISRIPDTEKVCIIGLAQQLGSLPDRLQKVEIFKQHLTFPTPTISRRKELLKSLLKGMELECPKDGSDVLDFYTTALSLRTSGYVIRDLKQLCRNAGLKSRRNDDVQDDVHLADAISKLNIQEKETKRSVNWNDFEYALENFKPSQQVEIESTLPKRSWKDIGGYDRIKQRIRQSTLVPLLQPEVFIRLGISAPSGLLLYGPSGCGKTMMVQALASECMMNVISIKGPEIFSKYLGETENKIRRLFAIAKKIAPCLVFIDEMDSIGTRRGWNNGGDSNGGVNERVLSTLLNEMDGVEGRQGVIVIGCTNRPQEIDDAILRPGRLDQLLYVEMPTIEDRQDIIIKLMQELSVDNDIDSLDLARRTAHCTGADLNYLFREAGTIALRENINIHSIGRRHLDQVLETLCIKAKQSVDNGVLNDFIRFQNDHGR